MTYKTQILAQPIEIHKEELREFNSKTAVNNEPKRLNVIVERSVYMSIKEYCVKNDISISEITRKLWLDYLKNHT